MKVQRAGGHLISKIHHLSGRVFNKKLKENGIDELNLAQGRIMFVLWRSNGIPIQRLAAETGLGKSTLTSMLDRLEQAGQINRIPSPDDRRQILIVASEKNLVAMKKYVQVSQEMNELFYQGFTADEIDQVESYLQRILNNLLE
ncbi:MAG: MarR family transcriptional regulator [Syntrophomonadaceae bacterium]|nr:MarR family transcriptional regulator [Syntrophomonadaceae bacterium]MDD3023439.1 MarR family transcriptional regulator [Syntrophomonadaceae bacterium]